MSYFLVFAISMLAGYLFGSVGVRHQKNTDIQSLIDNESIKRQAEGIYRKGDLLTEYEQSESSAGIAREISR